MPFFVLPRLVARFKYVSAIFRAWVVLAAVGALSHHTASAQPAAIAPIGSVATPTITFEWSDLSVASYDFQTSRDGAFDDNVFETFSGLTTTKCLPDLSPGSTVFWRVRESGGTWSSVYSFTMGTAVLPASAALSPTNGSRLPPNTPIELSYEPVIGATGYAVEVNFDSPDFSNINSLVYSSCNSTADVFFTISGYGAGQTFYWRVRGVTATDYGDWSPTSSFVVDFPPMGTTTGMSPVVIPTNISFAPPTGTPGTTVILSGLGGDSLSGVRSVSFGGVTAVTFTQSSANQISVVVPVGAVSGAIGVVTDLGPRASANNFIVTEPPAPPLLTSFSPQSGVVGTVVTIQGNGFTSTSVVRIGGVLVRDFTFISPREIRVTVPEGAVTGAITVETALGIVTGSPSFSVTFVPPARPTIVLQPLTPLGGASLSGSRFALRERQQTFFSMAQDFESALVFVGASAQQFRQPVTIRLNAAYTDASGRGLPNTTAGTVVLPAPLPAGARNRFGNVLVPSSPVRLGSFQGDLTPILEVGAVTTALNLGGTTLSLSATQPAAFVRVRARWSDQTFAPLSAGRNGNRTVSITLTPSVDYENVPTASAVTVVLTDPIANATPVSVLNPIPDAFGAPGSMRAVELEPSGLRPDGTPASVFYDDNFTPLSYAVTSSNPSIATASITPRNTASGAVPVLNYVVDTRAPLDSQTVFTVTALDGSAVRASTQFRFTVRVLRPQVTSIFPLSGPAGTDVIIFGSNVSAVTSVEFGGVRATNVRVAGEFQLIATVPVGAQTGVVTLRSLGGAGTSVQVFTVVPTTSVRASNWQAAVASHLGEMKITPQPAGETATLELNVLTADRFDIAVYDMLGHRVREVASGGLGSTLGTRLGIGLQRVEIDARGLPPGVYSVRVVGGSVARFVQLFVQR